MKTDTVKFKNAWDRGDNVPEVARLLKLQPGSVRTIAWRLRKQGLDLPHKPTVNFIRWKKNDKQV